MLLDFVDSNKELCRDEHIVKKVPHLEHYKTTNKKIYFIKYLVTIDFPSSLWTDWL